MQWLLRHRNNVQWVEDFNGLIREAADCTADEWITDEWDKKQQRLYYGVQRSNGGSGRNAEEVI